MKYHILPKTDLNVSKICLGTMTFGEQNSEREAHEQLDFAYDRGVNFLDTAELYAVPSTPKNNGLTEKYIGSWLAKEGNRNKYVVATKIVGPSPNLKYIRPNLGFDNASLKTALDGSLKRLKTDFVDIYQLHWPERKVNIFGERFYRYDPYERWEDNFLEIIHQMNMFVKEGKIRYWGLSNETAWGAMRYKHLAEKNNLDSFISIQNAYNVLNRKFEVDLAEVCMREDVRLLAYSPLAFGLLSGKYNLGKDDPSNRLNKYKNQMGRYSKQRAKEATDQYIALAQEVGISPTSLALAFVNHQVFLGANIIGATNLSQLEENINSIDIELSVDTIKKIASIYESFPDPGP